MSAFRYCGKRRGIAIARKKDAVALGIRIAQANPLWIVTQNRLGEKNLAQRLRLHGH
jgi:hypothetical protein